MIPWLTGRYNRRLLQHTIQGLFREFRCRKMFFGPTAGCSMFKIQTDMFVILQLVSCCTPKITGLKSYKFSKFPLVDALSHVLFRVAFHGYRHAQVGGDRHRITFIFGCSSLLQAVVAEDKQHFNEDYKKLEEAKKNLGTWDVGGENSGAMFSFKKSS